MAAAVAGKHVHVEKPLTLDRPSAEAAVAAAKRAGIVLAVGFNRRFHPSRGRNPKAPRQTASSAR